MIHRGVISTLERFIAYLIEVYKGAFPTWLAPTQATIIPVNNEIHADYAWKIQRELQDKGFRVVVDEANEKWAGRFVNHKHTKFHIKSLLETKNKLMEL